MKAGTRQSWSRDRLHEPRQACSAYPLPKSGDVLVSRPTARADAYAISVIPTQGYIVAVRYEDAVEIGRELARGLVVDGWYTCDHTHSVRIARHRR
jgi:hypothetical protein